MSVKEIQYLDQRGSCVIPQPYKGIVFVAQRNMISVIETGERSIHTFKAHDDTHIILVLQILHVQSQLFSSTEQEMKIWDITDSKKPSFLFNKFPAKAQWVCTYNEKICAQPIHSCITVVGPSLSRLIPKSGEVRLFTSSTTLFVVCPGNEYETGCISIYKNPLKKNKPSTLHCSEKFTQLAATENVLALLVGQSILVWDISDFVPKPIHGFKAKPNVRIKAIGSLFVLFDQTHIAVFNQKFDNIHCEMDVDVGQIVDLALSSQRLFVLGTEKSAIITFNKH